MKYANNKSNINVYRAIDHCYTNPMVDEYCRVYYVANDLVHAYIMPILTVVRCAGV